MANCGVVVGEHSGDLLAYELFSLFQKEDPTCTLTGVLGPKLHTLKAVSRFDMERLAVMGLFKPLLRVPELWWRRQALIREWRNTPPQVVLTVDAPEFNLGLAWHLKRAQIPVVHYVSPSVWAWRPDRVKTVAASVDHLLVLFPFETAYYENLPLKVSYVGHPLADRISPIEMATAQQNLSLPQDRPYLALLPGSRVGEITRHLPLFLQSYQKLLQKKPDFQAIIACPNEDRKNLIENIVRKHSLQIPIVVNRTHEVIAASVATLVVSGTATLETMLLEKPMVIIYTMPFVTFSILKHLVRTPYVGLPNILAQERLVPELIQEAASPQTIVEALLEQIQEAEALKQCFSVMGQSLRCNAAERACEIVKSYC